MEKDEWDIRVFPKPSYFVAISQVVRNSLQDGAWGAEERDGSFPFRKGQPFEVTIQVNHHSYKVRSAFIDYN